MNYGTPNDQLASRLTKISYVISGLVLCLVVLMRRVKFDVGIDFTFLPAVSAVLNTLVSICLMIALYYILQKNVTRHRLFMFSAGALSALFLICYVLYHFTTPETTYCFDGFSKYIYYFLLLTHIVLAAVSFPFILLTFIRGFTFQVAAHKKMARWVYPAWLYVAITGPLCYLMLEPCYV